MEKSPNILKKHSVSLNQFRAVCTTTAHALIANGPSLRQSAAGQKCKSIKYQMVRLGVLRRPSVQTIAVEKHFEYLLHKSRAN